MAIDYTTDRGRVRLLSADTNESAFLLSDTQVDALLSLEGGNVRLAAAAALDTIAASEVLVSKKIQTLDLSTDGPAVAKSLREQAAALRTQAAVTTPSDSTGFDVVDFDPASWLLPEE